MIGRLVNLALRHAGYVAAPLPLSGLVVQLRHHRVDCVLDVGAASGAYGKELRDLGYGGRIESFEPLREPFAALAADTARDPLWRAHNMALGARTQNASMHIAANSESSSLLEMLPRHETAAPEATYIGTEAVEVMRLDEVLGDVTKASDRLFLKIDTQGYEAEVLEGAGTDVERCVGLQVELSVVPLYLGQLLWRDALDKIEQLGFRLTDVLPVFRDPVSGELLQFDGIFVRADT